VQIASKTIQDLMNLNVPDAPNSLLMFWDLLFYFWD